MRDWGLTPGSPKTRSLSEPSWITALRPLAVGAIGQREFPAVGRIKHLTAQPHEHKAAVVKLKQDRHSEETIATTFSTK